MNQITEELWHETQAFVESALKETGVPGCSLGILQHGEIRSAGFGIGNVEKGSPVSAKTLFQVGSISKTFTATLAMKMVEEGKLDLHQPVRTYLPDFKVADEKTSAEVTPFHLLTHSSGWDGDLFVETGDGEDAVQKYVQRMATREQVFPLGQYFSYNNAGFVVMGAILQAITGQPLEGLYRTHIVEPLGAQHIFFSPAEAITYDFAVGHHVTPQGNQVARPWRIPRAVLPAGGIITTVGDLLQYAKCYLAKGKTEGGKQILKPETIDEMFTPKVPINQEDRTAVGYSWMRRDLEQGSILSHGGGTNGQITQLSLLPDQDFALAIFTNSDRGGSLVGKVEKFLLKTYLDISHEDPKAIDSTPEQLSEYAGVANRPGVNIYLDMVGKHLVGLEEVTFGFPSEDDPPPPPEPPFRLGRCAGDRLIVLDGDGRGGLVDIFRDADGKIIYARAGRMYRFSPKG